MDAFLPSLMTVGFAYGIAVMAWPIQEGKRAEMGLIAACLVMLCPLLVPPEHVMVRALAFLPCGDLFFKMVDYSRLARQDGAGRRADYLRFLVPFPVFLVVYLERDRRTSARFPRWPEVARSVLWSTVSLACVGAVMTGLVGSRRSFALDHGLKLAIVAVMIESLSRAMQGLERLAGYGIEPIDRSCVVSRTPLEFWRRYNTRVHRWLEWNVFRPSGGRRSPVRGVLATFFFSAIFHEFAFDVATSRVDGYQFTFFMIQAPAVIASPQIERFARRSGIVGDALARILTIAWMYATSIFFFRGVDRIFPFFYASEPWLP